MSYESIILGAAAEGLLPGRPIPTWKSIFKDQHMTDKSVVVCNPEAFESAKLLLEVQEFRMSKMVCDIYGDFCVSYHDGAQTVFVFPVED